MAIETQPNYLRKYSRLLVTLASAAGTLLVTSPAALAGTNEDARAEITALQVTHSLVYYPSLVPIAGNSVPGEFEFFANVGLKHLPAYLVAPPEVVRRPAPGSCTVVLTRNRRQIEQRSNFLDLIENWVSPYDATGPFISDTWGDLGQPTVDHYNTDVQVSVRIGGTLFGVDPDNEARSVRSIDVPVGLHNAIWRADTVATPAIDFVPWHLLTGQLNKHVAKKAEVLAENSLVKRAAIEFLGDLIIASGIKAATDNSGLDSVKQNGVYTEVKQSIVVIDPSPPEIHHALAAGLDPGNPYVVRAVDPGGSKFESFEPDLMANFAATDDCASGRDLVLEAVLQEPPPGSEAPANFFPTNETREVVIRAVDPGPSEVACPLGDIGPCYSLNGNSTEMSVWVQVRDNEPPLLIAPNDIVAEATPEVLAAGRAFRADSTTPEGDPAHVEVGNPAVFDLGDRYPAVQDDGVSEFPVGRRTTITWTATDIANNVSVPKQQMITIKLPGTNTTPVADAKVAFAKVSDPVEILLTGFDQDPAIDGMTDPLNFRITRPPSNGFLLAPPIPYFIDDYRRTWEDESQPCDEETPDAIKFPQQISVLDNGATFILANQVGCNGTRQISIFDRDGDFTGSTPASLEVWNFDVLGGVPGAFDDDLTAPSWRPVDAREPGLYFIEEASQDGFPTIHHRPVDGDGVVAPVADWRAWAFSNFGVKNFRLLSVDSRGYAWVLGGGLGLYKLGTRGFMTPLTNPDGESGPATGFAGVEVHSNSIIATSMATDSGDFLYISDPTRNRILKFEPASEVANPIRLVGWMGRCDGGVNCDIDHARSKGFSCTDDTCHVEQPGGERPAAEFQADRAAEFAACGLPTANVAYQGGDGCAPGQFNFPTKIALDPNDTLYVADYDNLRVQRFSPDGEFAGEAKSKCDGSCFVLGDFGRPRRMTVNSFGFYVLDEAKQLLHVYEASPFSDVTPTSAVVKYQSNFDILGANELTTLDSFEYSVNDGFRVNGVLAESAPATVTVTVDRNHRAPTALSTVTVDGATLNALPVTEDVARVFDLQGHDPDAQDAAALQFDIVTLPANGTLVEVGGSWQYTPNGNYAGPDEFRFTVSDAATSTRSFVSEPGAVHIDVTPDPDPPSLSMPDPLEAGVGFPVTLMVGVDDPDTDAADMGLHIDWGDGCTDTMFEDTTIIGCETARPDGDPENANSLSLTLAAGNPGILTGKHVYRTAGVRSVRVCMGDQEPGPASGPPSADPCLAPIIDTLQTVPIDVLTKTDTAAAIADDLPRDGNNEITQPALAGQSVVLTVTVRNRTPSSDTDFPGVDLGASLATIDVDDRLVIGFVPPGCSITRPYPQMRMACALPALATGTETVLQFDVIADPALTEAAEQAITVALDAAEPDVDGGYFWATTLPFEPDPTLDPDGDGVPNGDDAFPADPTEWEDTDADGIGNNADRDDDGDGLSDTLENRYRLDPRDASDAGSDLDGDGLDNRTELMLGTHPRLADSDRDGEADSVDSCPAMYNADQYDENGDSLGDACDPRSFVAMASVGDADGDVVTDMALLKTIGGASTAYVKSGASDDEVAVLPLLATPAQPERLFGLDGLTGGLSPALALVYSDDSGGIHVRIDNAWTGRAIADYAALPAGRVLIDVARVADAVDGDSLVFLSNDDAGTITANWRNANDGSERASVEFFSPHHLGYAVTTGDGNVAVALAIDPSGTLVAEARSLASGALVADWTVASGDWLDARVLGQGDDVFALGTDTSGVAEIGTWSIAAKAETARFPVFDDTWTPLGLDTVAWIGGIDALVVAAVDAANEVEVRVYDPANGAELQRLAFLAAGQAPRGLDATSGWLAAADSTIRVLASDVDAAVSLEQRDALTGASLATLTAAAAAPPPPPPPPPPPAPTSGGGGGGAGGPLLLILLALARHRCRQGNQGSGTMGN